MKIHQLMYFIEAARQEHIGKAAKILAISPSAISHSISALEEELGRELFSKQGKNILLTSHGKLLMERVSKLMAELDAIKEELTSEDADLQGTYRMAASHLLCPQLLLPAWAGVQAKNPRLRAELFTLRSADVLSGVSSGEYDFGICFSPQSHASIQIKPLYRGQLLIAVRPEHPVLKVNGKRERLRRVSEYPCALPKSYQGIDNCETHPVFSEFGITPRTEVVFDSYEVAVTKILLGNTWSLLPDWVARRHGLITLTADGWDAPVNISALWPTNRLLTRTLVELVEALEREVREHTPPPMKYRH